MGIGFVLVLAGSVLATRHGSAPAEREAARDQPYASSDSVAG
jgi:hypothetical protein